MAQAKLDMAAVFNLPWEEKLKLAQDLWDDLASSPQNVPVYEWQLDEIARRRAALREDPESGLTWEQVEERLRRRHDR